VIRILITDGSGRLPARHPVAVDYIQVREPGLSMRDLTACVRKLVSDRGPRVLVNDRADVALACGAAGVHLRSGSVSPHVLRRIAPTDFVISVACHNAADVARAEDEGADFALLAPVFAPLSKPSVSPPLGLDALRSVASAARIPVIALGGITEANAALCLDAGAAGVAGITLFR